MIRLGIATESESDARMVQSLVDRLVCGGVYWIEQGSLHDHRSWVGLDGEPYLNVHSAKKRFQKSGGPFFGRFSGQTGADSELMWKKLFWLFAQDSEVPPVVVATGDTDGESDRKLGLALAMEREWPFQVVAALADPEIESWQIAVWTQESDAEGEAAAAIRQRIGFFPHEQPHRLTAGKPTDPKDAKAILAKLCAAGRDPETRWETLDLARLRTDAAGACGLRALVEQVEGKLIPQFTGQPSRG